MSCVMRGRVSRLCAALALLCWGSISPSFANFQDVPSNSFNNGLDLPIEEPVYNPNGQVLPIQPEVPIEDPRDEPPPVFFGEELDIKDSVVFVIDVSDSMEIKVRPPNSSQDPVTGIWTFEDPAGIKSRLDRAKEELIRAISMLSEETRFDIVAYNWTARLWLPTLVPASTANKAAATAWVKGLSTSGGTATAPAVALGLSLDRANKKIILLSDGAPTDPAPPPGVSIFDFSLQIIRNANTQGATIDVFGMCAIGAWRQFLQNVASQSGGSYYDVQ